MNVSLCSCILWTELVFCHSSPPQVHESRWKCFGMCCTGDFLLSVWCVWTCATAGYRVSTSSSFYPPKSSCSCPHFKLHSHFTDKWDLFGGFLSQSWRRKSLTKQTLNHIPTLIWTLTQSSSWMHHYGNHYQQQKLSETEFLGSQTWDEETRHLWDTDLYPVSFLVASSHTLPLPASFFIASVAYFLFFLKVGHRLPFLSLCLVISPFVSSSSLLLFLCVHLYSHDVCGFLRLVRSLDTLCCWFNVWGP